MELTKLEYRHQEAATMDAIIVQCRQGDRSNEMAFIEGSVKAIHFWCRRYGVRPEQKEDAFAESVAIILRMLGDPAERGDWWALVGKAVSLAWRTMLEDRYPTTGRPATLLTSFRALIARFDGDMEAAAAVAQEKHGYTKHAFYAMVSSPGASIYDVSEFVEEPSTAAEPPSDAKAAVAELLELLTDEERDVVKRLYGLGTFQQSLPEIAAALGVSLSSVKRRSASARAKMVAGPNRT